MWKRVTFSVLGALVLLSLVTSGASLKAEEAAAKDVNLLKALSSALVDIGKEVRPSVVHVTTIRKAKTFGLPQQEWPRLHDDWLRRFMPRSRPERMPDREGTGSGVIVDAKGYVLTNNHVVQGADRVSIRFSEKDEVVAKVVGTDPKTDLAVLKIEREGLKAARLGDSDRLEVGEIVLAIGAPFGLDSTVTLGIVSAKGRTNLNLVDYENFIQTDAAINPGNSGGALVNLDGEVVGINTAIVSRSGSNAGVGFTIPINMAKTIMASLIAEGKVTRGFLGIHFQELDKDLSEQFGVESTAGVLVVEVVEGAAADQAGIKVHDVVLKFDGQPIRNGNELRHRVAASPVGNDREVVVWRDGKEVALKVTLGELVAETAAGSGAPKTEEVGYGLTLQQLTPELAETFGHEPGTPGLVVTEVQPDSPAAAAGLRPGYLILEAARKPMRTLPDFQAAIKASEGKNLLLRVRNAERGTHFLVLKKKP